ncbi:MAG: radical SAM protein [Candidatus Omnitrophota bacterium]|nr:MAG: radical SAM protein [Candidatus Omnitrophota bacterium]
MVISEKKGNNLIGERTEFRTTRLLLLLTHDCCLKCKYCFVSQSSKRYMSEHVLLKSVDFLMTSSADVLQLHFFGGEPLMLPFKILKKGIMYANKVANAKKRKLTPILTTNGVLLNEEKVRFFKENNVLLELSLDGGPGAQRLNRPQKNGLPDSYSLIVRNLPIIFKYNTDCQVSMVVSPMTVGRIVDNFSHLVNLGFRNIFIMIACGVKWSNNDRIVLARNLIKLRSLYLKLRLKNDIRLQNLTEWFPPFRMNTEISVDFDGNIYSACISYLIQNYERKRKFILGNINEIKESMDAFEKKRLTNEEAMEIIFRENNVTKYLNNTILAGQLMSNFVAYLNNALANRSF